MVFDEYSSQVTSQFESILSKRDLAKPERYYETMVKDIFGGTEPVIQSGVDGMSILNLTLNPYEFLTQGDKELLADTYEYADKNNIDFKYIQQFAYDIADFRKHDNGKLLANFNEGHFSGAGHQITVSFTDKDQATINSLFDNEEALFSSAIDGSFISFMAESGLSALSHRGSYQFLQHMVEVTAGIETSISVKEFEVFEGSLEVEDRYIFTVSDNKSLLRPDPDVVCKNGLCEVTEKGRKNNVTLEQNKSSPVSVLDLKSKPMESLFQFRVNAETQEKIWFQWFMDD